MSLAKSYGNTYPELLSTLSKKIETVAPDVYSRKAQAKSPRFVFIHTLWCQLEDMFQLIVTPQGIEKVMIQLKDTPTKVYAIGAELFLSKVPLEVLQN